MFNKEKKYFQKKLKGVQYMIWDLQFKRAKTKMIREEIRMEYDNCNSRLSVLQDEIKKQAEKPSMEKGEIARLDDKKVLLDRDIERFLGQMKGLDLEINGSKPTQEYQDGVQGINHQLDALRELQGMLKDYIKSL